MLYSLNQTFEKIDKPLIEPAGQYPAFEFLGEKTENDDGRVREFVIDSAEISDPKTFQPSDYIMSCHLVSKRLLEVMKNAGVDNLEIFPAIIKSYDGAWVSEDYVVINLLGGNHGTVEIAEDGKLDIKIPKVPPLHMFIFAPNQVAVDETLAEAIQKGNFRDVELINISRSIL